MGKNKKVPRPSGNPYSGKKPKEAAQTKPRGPFRWSTAHTVLVGAFGFAQAEHAHLLHDIIPRLHGFQTMNWEQLGGQGCHEIAFGSLSKDGQAAVQEACDDDLDVYSLRINGAMRVLGTVDGNVCLLRWFDPEHQFCPSTLKNT
jgi:hypothetical protein